MSSSAKVVKEKVLVFAQLCVAAYGNGDTFQFNNNYYEIPDLKDVHLPMSVFCNVEENNWVIVFRGLDQGMGPVDVLVSAMTTAVVEATKYLEYLIQAVTGCISKILDPKKGGKDAKIFVTGHGVGGYKAEVAAAVLTLPGTAFCSPALTADCKEFILSKSKSTTPDSFQCIVCKEDTVGNINIKGSVGHLKKPLEIVNFFYPVSANRNYVEFYSILNLVKYFNRSVLCNSTNVDIATFTAYFTSDHGGIGNSFHGKQYYNRIYQNGDALKFEPALVFDMYVIDLTIAKKEFVTPIIEDGIKFMNNIYLVDFAKKWGSSGTLKNVTSEIAPKELGILSNLLYTWGKADRNIYKTLTSQVVNKNLIPSADWTKSAIFFLVEKIEAVLAEEESSYVSGGFHNEVVVATFDVPYGVVYVQDAKWTVSFSHEVMELLANPWANRLMFNNTKIVNVPIPESANKEEWPVQNWIIEVCDPCASSTWESRDLGYKPFEVCDFLFPEYFNGVGDASTKLNYLTTTTRISRSMASEHSPFPMAKGGYLGCINPTSNKTLLVYKAKNTSNESQNYLKLVNKDFPF